MCVGEDLAKLYFIFLFFFFLFLVTDPIRISSSCHFGAKCCTHIFTSAARLASTGMGNTACSVE